MQKGAKGAWHPHYLECLELFWCQAPALFRVFRIARVPGTRKIHAPERFRIVPVPGT